MAFSQSRTIFSKLLYYEPELHYNILITAFTFLYSLFFSHYLLPAPFPFEDYVADRFPEILPIGANRIF